MAKFMYCMTQLFDWKAQRSQHKRLLDCRDCYEKYKCEKYRKYLIAEDMKNR